MLLTDLFPFLIYRVQLTHKKVVYGSLRFLVWPFAFLLDDFFRFNLKSNLKTRSLLELKKAI